MPPFTKAELAAMMVNPEQSPVKKPIQAGFVVPLSFFRRLLCRKCAWWQIIADNSGSDDMVTSS